MRAQTGKYDPEPGTDSHRNPSCGGPDRIVLGPVSGLLHRPQGRIECPAQTCAKPDHLRHTLRVGADRVAGVVKHIARFPGDVNDDTAGLFPDAGGSVADRFADIPRGLCGVGRGVDDTLGDLDGLFADLRLFGLGLQAFGAFLGRLDDDSGSVLDLFL